MMADPNQKPAGGAIPPLDMNNDPPRDAAHKSAQVTAQEKAAKDSEEAQKAARDKAAEPQEWLFDPTRPAAYETGRTAAARAAWMGRSQIANSLRAQAIEARELHKAALRNGSPNADTLDANAKKAEDAAAKAQADVAPKPEPLDETRENHHLAHDHHDGAESDHH